MLNKLYRFLPVHVLRTLYFSMVQSRMMYCILTWAWGFDYYRIEKLQKKIVRNISSSKYNAHSEPLFKVLDILKIEHLFSQSCLKFAYNFKKGQLPKYFFILSVCPKVRNSWSWHERCWITWHFLYPHSYGCQMHQIPSSSNTKRYASYDNQQN